MAMTQERDRRAVQAAIKQHGGVENLPIIDGPRIERFDPVKLANALDQEIERAKAIGWERISLHMTLDDARRLSRYIRK